MMKTSDSLSSKRKSTASSGKNMCFNSSLCLESSTCFLFNEHNEKKESFVDSIDIDDDLFKEDERMDTT
jgi:hypothetical protein